MDFVVYQNSYLHFPPSDGMTGLSGVTTFICDVINCSPGSHVTTKHLFKLHYTEQDT